MERYHWKQDKYTMMTDSKTLRLLREAVVTILNEDDTGAIYGAMMSANAEMMGGMGGWLGMHYTSDQEFINAFVSPFTDVVKTALGGTKEIVRKVGTTLVVAYQTLASSLLPFCKATYEDVFKKEADDVKAIQAEYGPVYDRVWAQFKNHDVQLAAFMCSPGGFITQKASEGAYTASLQLLDVATGGQFRNIIERLLIKHVKGKKGSNASAFWGRSGDEHVERFGESLLREKDEKEKQQLVRDDDSDYAEFFKQVLNTHTIKAMLEQSTFAKSMSSRGLKLVDRSFADIEREISPVMKAGSSEDLAAALKKHIDLSKIPEDKKEKADEEVLHTVKATVVKFNDEVVQNRLKMSGVEKDSTYYVHCMNFAKSIRSLDKSEK